MSRKANENRGSFSRRIFLKQMGMAPLLLRSAPFHGLPLAFAATNSRPNAPFPFADIRLKPHYPVKSPLEDVLRRVAPGSDQFITEKHAFEIGELLEAWSQDLRASVRDLSRMAKFLAPSIEACSFTTAGEILLRGGGGLEVVRRQLAPGLAAGRDQFVQHFRAYLGNFSKVETAEFQIVGIKQISDDPLTVQAAIRYDLVGVREEDRREERVGSWRTEWFRDETGGWSARKWEADEETRAIAHGSSFVDITSQALDGTASYREQMLRGTDYWRTVLDGACGIDVYGNSGAAAGDYDNDGLDDLYVCQPAGLPNRLYRNRGDGTFEDVTEKAGVGVLDSTACALFADFRNQGLQDLLVVCGTGPLLFQNNGDGTFSLKRDAFKFAVPPQGAFTHAALADYDRDGRLDIYFCLYSYYLGLDQYHYPVPYFDARNGPANFLLHNEGDGTFVDRTEAAGLNADNDRFSFACAWGDYKSDGFPDLYVANDFGRSNLYRNSAEGTFTVVSGEANVEDVGAGMSACWSDFDNDGDPDIYVANMWSAAGQRVSQQEIFHVKAPENIRSLYKRHARGNSLYRNQGDGKFQNVCRQAGVEMGRWSWSSDLWDFDHDGYPDIYIANGYISAPDKSDLGSFFWRQVVAESPNNASPTPAYEHGWNALNELIRSDSSWSGYERNVFYANNRDGTFSEVSGAVGLDFVEDSRTFVLADLDHDGRQEIILKNRNAPQLRILANAMNGIGHSIVFRLRGTKSNRDAIGTAITVEAGALRQTRYLQAGSGFLAQHSKEVFFGVGASEGPVRAKIHWPSGLTQEFDSLPVNHRVEVEEGSSTFAAKPFAERPRSYLRAGQPAPPEELPASVETWLIEPLKAPEISLPDLAGNVHDLSSFRGGFVLLNFWVTTAPASRDQLIKLREHRSALAAVKLNVVAVNLDGTENVAAAQDFAKREDLSFPVLFATPDVAGIYNIIYRYLFDRRRDLAIPTSLLLDREGMIVKVYQGLMHPDKLVEDVKSPPNNAAERRKKALPLRGELYQGSFQRNDFTYGIALFQHGYLEQAAESFRQVVATKPDDPEAYYNLGTLNLRRTELQQARQYLEQTLKLRPNYPEAWNNLGMVAAQQGQPDEAIRDFQQSLLLRPDYLVALLNLGNLYRRQGAFEKAQELLNHAIQVQPDDPEVNYSMGMIYAQQDQLQRASFYLEKALEVRPDYAEALNNLGVLSVRAQNYAKAEEQFKNCIRVAPSFDQAYLNLARLYALQNDREKARDILHELLRLQPQHSAALHALELLQ